VAGEFPFDPSNEFVEALAQAHATEVAFPPRQALQSKNPRQTLIVEVACDAERIQANGFWMVPG
jgi:hypothetical protein